MIFSGPYSTGNVKALVARWAKPLGFLLEHPQWGEESYMDYYFSPKMLKGVNGERMMWYEKYVWSRTTGLEL
ncbi:hypothetical protein ACS0TY_015249 [Phlomoides rotata]